MGFIPAQGTEHDHFFQTPHAAGTFPTHFHGSEPGVSLALRCWTSKQTPGTQEWLSRPTTIFVKLTLDRFIPYKALSGAEWADGSTYYFVIHRDPLERVYYST